MCHLRPLIVRLLDSRAVDSAFLSLLNASGAMRVKRSGREASREGHLKAVLLVLKHLLLRSGVDIRVEVRLCTS